MPLTLLDVADASMVNDLSPLKGMPLTWLHCYKTRVSDLSPLRDMPLKTLDCDFRPERDTEILRSIKTLETINGKPVGEVLNAAEGFVPLPPVKQVEAVVQKLRDSTPASTAQ